MHIAQTNRLQLRHFCPADPDALMHVFGDPEVMFYGTGAKDRAWVENWLREVIEENYPNWEFGLWAVELKANDKYIGYCGLSQFKDLGGQPEIEIGYRLPKSHWGEGLATEAAIAVRDYFFKMLKLPRLVAMIDPRNMASINVATKLGMHYEKDVVFQGFLDRLYVMEQPGGSSSRM
jgi:RimJ/RimL family protein N-acetyltransferase